MQGGLEAPSSNPGEAGAVVWLAFELADSSVMKGARSSNLEGAGAAVACAGVWALVAPCAVPGTAAPCDRPVLVTGHTHACLPRAATPARRHQIAPHPLCIGYSVAWAGIYNPLQHRTPPLPLLHHQPHHQLRHHHHFVRSCTCRAPHIAATLQPAPPDDPFPAAVAAVAAAAPALQVPAAVKMVAVVAELLVEQPWAQVCVCADVRGCVLVRSEPAQGS